MALADAAVQTDVSISSVAACEAWAQFEAALRASTQNATETQPAPSPDADEERTQSNENMTHDLSRASIWQLALSELSSRLVRLITGGKGVTVDMGKFKAAETCALYDCKLCRQVVHDYFD
eukprot:6683536-Prymnesium_polylepis.1